MPATAGVTVMALTQACKEQSPREALDGATTVLLLYQSPGGQEQLIDLSISTFLLGQHGLGEQA